MKIAPLVVLITVFCSCSIFGKDYYSNSNKYLFVAPDYIGTGGANLTYHNSGLPMSNPANLALDSSQSAFMSHTGYYENSFTTTLFSYTGKVMEKLGIGASLSYLRIPDIEITKDLKIDETTGFPIYDPDLVSYETSSETYLNLSGGYEFLNNERFTITGGAALHVLRRRLIDWTGYGIALDLASTVKFKRANISLSLLLDDITSNYIHWSSSYSDNGLPHARLGVGYEKIFNKGIGLFRLSYKTPDLLGNDGVSGSIKESDNSTDSEEGLPKEMKPYKDPLLLITAAAYGASISMKNVTARAGFDEAKRFSFGAGIGILENRINLDFSYTLGGVLPGTYAIGTKYRW